MPPKVNEEILKALADIKLELADIKSDLCDIKSNMTKIEDAVKVNSTSIASNTANIETLASNLNDREQHNRNWSVRIFGVALPDGVATDPLSTANFVYDKIIKIVLANAVSDGVLHSVPPCVDVVDYAHTLRSSREDAPPPIILRFRSRIYRHLVFKSKKAVLSTSADSELSKVRIVEDLTRLNYSKLIELRKKEIKCWSMSGRIYFIEDGVRKCMK